MSFFTSRREKQLWLWVVAIMVAIYSTLGLAGRLAEVLRERGIIDAAFFYSFLLAVATIFGIGLKWRPGKLEIWMMLGVVISYTMVIVRMGLSPEERTHIFEYGVVAAIIYQALIERQKNGRRVPIVALLAVAMTWILCWIDEGIQMIIPNRVYDIRDVLFNLIAAVMAVTASVAMMWARRQISKASSKHPIDQ